ncbi:MAG: methyltransferase domain-containing protein [Actinocatenispora sp.]
MTLDAQRELAARLGDQLPADWRDAYDANPRHLFLPERVWYDVDEPIDRATDPTGWLTFAYADDSVITQLHDGAEDSDHGYPISSSCSMPSVVFTMLRWLAAGPGHRVLEIGTGTGWTAALMATRLGDDKIVSVEVDPTVAERARASLVRAGRNPLVVTGDGAHGYPARAPYDRVIATCSVETVPYAWVRQCRPGGRILTPWGPTADNTGLLRLSVSRDGTRADGRIVDWASFMRLRGQRRSIPDEPANFEEVAARSPIGDLDLADFLSEGARLGVALHLPDTRIWTDGTGGSLWLLAPGAWACVAAGEVRQAGDRALWDEAVAGYAWWVAAGRPDRDRYGVTVTAAGQTVWLDEPDHVIRPAPAATR